VHVEELQDLKERDHLGDLDVDGMMSLKQFLVGLTGGGKELLADRRKNRVFLTS
jgi:hypothetical protein